MNAPIKIETGIEIPTPGKRGGRPSIYPLANLEIGQSFAIPITGERCKASRNDLVCGRLSAAISYVQRKTGKKFATRALKDEGVVRCWRVA